MLLDYQNVLLNMITEQERKDRLVSAVNRLLVAARKNNVAIVHCLMDTAQDPPPTNKANTQWPIVYKPMFAANPDLAAEYPDFAAPKPNGDHETTSLRAPGYRSALVAEGIVPLLREKLGIKHLILGGIATSGAVLGTMSHGTDLDFVVSIVEDACWDPNQAVHNALIDTVFPSLAWVATVDEAVTYLSS